ncbi:MAG: tripartite tricarboxylate transporter substrate binding protein [Burkholderiales bacterium]|nr:tripartite tricarboxylate transporter substrate binding protein [Burkholderiales bacterium]
MKRVVLRLLLSGLAFVFSAAAPAQSYPARPVRIVAPFPPGNTADILGRLIGQQLSERLGQQFIVDNRPGASGQIGLLLAAKAAPDGYTITIGQGGNIAVAPHTYKKLPYDTLRDFVPVAQLATNYLALAVHPSVPFRSMKDFIAYAKAHPGKLSFASNGEGGFPHLAMELLRTQAGFTYLHVPYKGSGQIVSELLGGQVDAAFDGYTGLAPYVRAGKLRLLGISNPTRSTLLPDVPAIAEAVPGYEFLGWFGFLAPAGTPREIVALLNKQINQAMTAPSVRAQMTLAGLDVVTQPPEFFAETIRRDHAKFGKLVREIGFQPR